MKTEVRGDPPVVDERQQWLWQQARGASWVRGDGGGRWEAMIWWWQLEDKSCDAMAEWHWWLWLSGQHLRMRGARVTADETGERRQWWWTRGLSGGWEEMTMAFLPYTKLGFSGGKYSDIVPHQYTSWPKAVISLALQQIYGSTNQHSRTNFSDSVYVFFICEVWEEAKK